ncbi:MAG: T9SS type A sorting domain-containing protein [Bacteroidota bacterium]|nr:T9SS type A sorting domain-containing protein [Bacteroidota bacterium]
MKNKSFLVLIFAVLSIQLAAQPLIVSPGNSGNLTLFENMLEKPTADVLNGCSAQEIATRNPAQLSTSISYSTAGCTPSIATVNVTGGNPPYTYYWAPGWTLNWRYCNQAGTYCVTVTDAALCTKIDSFVLTNNPAISLSITDTVIYNCSPNSGTIDITIQNGLPPYTFAWSNGATTEDLFNIPPGYYFVTIVDGNYCYRTDSWDIEDYSQPYVMDGAYSNTDCQNLNNGTVTVSAWNGISPYSYLWSTGDTTQTISNLDFGIYSYTVTDACNFEIIDSIVLEYEFSANYEMAALNTLCGDLTGMIQLYNMETIVIDSIYLMNTVSGQAFFPDPSYKFDSIAAGNYQLYVIDTFLCVDSLEVEIEQIDDFIALMPTADTVECPGDTVTLQANIFEGAEYIFDQIDFDSIPVSAQAISIPDLHDDSQYGPFSIGFDFTFFDQSYSEFYIGSNGWISFVPISGPGYLDHWETQAIPNPDLQSPRAVIMAAYRDWDPSLPSANWGVFYEYSGTSPNRKLTVTWKSIALFSCTNIHGDFQVVIHENGNMVDINLTNIPVCPSWNHGHGVCGIQNETGTLAYTVPGRNNTTWETANESWRFYPSIVQWYGPNNVSLGSGMEITVYPESPGTYYAEYNSACGLETDSIEIFISTAGLSTYLGDDFILCEGETTSLGMPGWDYYQWSNGESTSQLNINGAGIYSVSTTSGTCNWTDEITVGYDENTNEYSYDPFICEGDTILFEMDTAYFYNWDNGSIYPSYSVTASGNYFVTVSTINCNWADSFEVEMRPLPLGILPSDTTMCHNDTFEIGAGASSYSYLWNSGSANAILTTDTAGLFIVDKSDTYGCSVTDSVLITYQAEVLSSFNFFETFNHVQFTNQSQNSYWYTWNFGDGSPLSYQTNPEHDYPVLNQNMWYTATLISTNQCGADTSFLQIFTFDIEEIGGNPNIQIYPNPNKGNFFLSGNLKSNGNLLLCIFNSTGQEIYQKKISSEKIKISEEIKLGQVAPGMYYLKIQQKENNWVWKVVVGNL